MTISKQTVGDLVARLGAPQQATPTELLGGKGARLDELIRAGLPVPPAFCLTTDLFDHFRRAIGLDGPAPDEQSRAIREKIMAAVVPDEIAQVVFAAYGELGRPRVAVRSSAVREDSAAQSFAGQHDTVLDVHGEDALLEAIKTCWASLWSDRAVAYRETVDAGTIAVVIQQMIAADAAGVLFTRDPISGRTDRFVIDACWGLGEGLVAGRVTSDSFQVDPTGQHVVEQNIRYKVTRCAAVRSGVVDLVKVDEAHRSTSCLTAEQLGRIAALALRVRELYGAEQDIEWALLDDEFHLLQARPITTPTAQAPPRSPYDQPQPEPIRHGTMWSRMDIGEIFTGVMTPLGLSFAQYYQHNVHGDAVRAVGVRDTCDISEQMGYFQGYVYLNISYTAYVLSQALPMRDQTDFTERFASEEIDLTNYRNPFGSYTLGPAGWLSTAFWVRTSVHELRDMRNRTDRMVQARLSEYDRAHRMELSSLDHRSLSAEMNRRLQHFHDMHVGYMPYFMNGFAFYGVLEQMCRAWLGERGDRFVNRLKTDMSNLRTVESAREVWELAQAAKRRPRVLAIICTGSPSDVAVRLRSDEQGQVFWHEQMEPFLRENGARAHQEMELTHPRWIDDLTYVFQMVRRYSEEGFSIDHILAVEHGASDDELRASIRALPWPKRRAMQGVISLYEKCSKLRETARVSMIGSIWLVRQVVYEVGSRLIETGVLRSLDEVAYLDFADVLRYLEGSEDPRDIFARAEIEKTRRQFQNYARLPAPPLSFIGEWDVTKRIRPLPDGPRLEGLGASAGRAIGRARIIEDLAWQADEFRVGEILVTKYTDSSWTPLFAIAAGIVTDIGSMLSHSSIVSREFRVPAVVNTRHATCAIKTGDLITVDGDRGVVEVVEE